MEAYTQTKPISEIAESSHNGNSKLQAMMQQINDKDKNGHEDIENDQIAQKETHPDQEGENESNCIYCYPRVHQTIKS